MSTLFFPIFFSLLLGLANASIPTPEPVLSRPMFGAHGLGPSRNSVLFVSKACLEKGIPEKNDWRVSNLKILRFKFKV